MTSLRNFFNWILLVGSLAIMGFSAQAFAQDTGDMLPETSSDGVSTEGIFNKMPAAYKIKGIVRSGEVRTSEYLFTAAITGNSSATALASDRVSHAGRFAGVRIYCLSAAGALCQVPALTKNGTPITDNTVMRARQMITVPFDQLLAVDTSDSLTINGSATISGAGAGTISRVQYELYTPRNFQLVTGSLGN